MLLPTAHGAEGNRTPDLLNAIQALSQLSYVPAPAGCTWRRWEMAAPQSVRKH